MSEDWRAKLTQAEYAKLLVIAAAPIYDRLLSEAGTTKPDADAISAAQGRIARQAVGVAARLVDAAEREASLRRPDPD